MVAVSGGVWPPPGIRPAVPAERPGGPRSKPWLEPGYGVQPPLETVQAFGGVRTAFTDLVDGFLALGAAAQRARAQLAMFVETFRDVDRPETGAPPP